ncbi:MAG: hypothetical protein ACJAWD_000703 [Methylophilaceae bacterium]|jgi:hypothetical protein
MHTMMIRKEDDELITGTLNFILKEANPDAMSAPIVVRSKPKKQFNVDHLTLLPTLQLTSLTNPRIKGVGWI